MVVSLSVVRNRQLLGEHGIHDIHRLHQYRTQAGESIYRTQAEMSIRDVGRSIYTLD